MKPLRHIVSIGNHSFYMEFKSIFYFFYQFIICLSSHNNRAWNILKTSTIIMITPRYVYYYFFHFLCIFTYDFQLLPTSLFPYAIEKKLIQHLILMTSYCNFPLLFGVFILSMVTLYGNQKPSICFKESDYLYHFI